MTYNSRRVAFSRSVTGKMPAPYSLDLRQRVITDGNAGIPDHEVAEKHSIGEATVHRWKRLVRDTGSPAPMPHGGGQPRALTVEHEILLIGLVETVPDRTLEEQAQELAAAGAPSVCARTLSRVLERLKYTRKKKSLIAAEQQTDRVQAERAKFREDVASMPIGKLVFVDESGSNIGMTPDYAWGQRSLRVHDFVPRNRGDVTTMIGAMGINGIRCLMTIEGATDTPVFDAFVEHFLVPTLLKGDLVILDNLGAHKPQHILDRITAAGAGYRFLPPYSPDLNPIENCWSKLKELLKKMRARTVAKLDRAIARAIDLITPSDASAWFRHCGYEAQPK